MKGNLFRDAYTHPISLSTCHVPHKQLALSLGDQTHQ